MYNMSPFQRELVNTLDQQSGSCSYTEPNSLVQGCIDSLASPGHLAIEGGGLLYQGVKGKVNPIDVLKITAGAAAYACGEGIINTAIDNCNITNTSNTNKADDILAPVVPPVMPEILPPVMPPVLQPIGLPAHIDPLGLNSLGEE